MVTFPQCWMMPGMCPIPTTPTTVGGLNSSSFCPSGPRACTGIASAAICRLWARKRSLSATNTWDKAGNSPAISANMFSNRSLSLHFSTSSLVMESLLVRMFQPSFTFCQGDKADRALLRVMFKKAPLWVLEHN